MTGAAQKFIVWDWNGTLINDAYVNHACFNVILTSTGKKEIDFAVYQETFRIPIDGFYLDNGFTVEEFAARGTELQDIYHHEYNKRIVDVAFREGATEILALTRDRDVAHIILSNHMVSAIIPHLSRLAAQDFFWGVLAHADRLEQDKWGPKGDRLKSFMHRHTLRPENGIIVGDTPEETVIARNIGLVSIAITGGFASYARLKAARPDYLIDHLRDMKPILQERGFAP